MSALLFISAFVVAACGLVYELVAASLTSSLLGDSVLQFSLIIGSYMFSMGLGAYLSRWVRRGLLSTFLQIQFAVGAIGGVSALALTMVYAFGTGYHFVLYLLVGLIGTLVGIEIPLILRLLEERYTLRDLVSQVLSLDYLGALVASLVFPLILLPWVGLVRTALIFGMLNVILGLVIAIFYDQEARWRGLQVEGATLLAILVVCFVSANRLTSFAEEALYADPIVLTKTTPYQRIVVTSTRTDLRLYLNSNLQFSSRDEYRYHEALVVPPLRSVQNPAEVLILGGGDGLAASVLLKDPRVKRITLVELDPAMVELFSTNPVLTALNNNSLNSARLRVVHGDAFIWLSESKEKFDLAIVDFPDPSSYAIGKLYTKLFYQRLKSRLNDGAAITVQCSSPLFARRTFWCVANTIAKAGFEVRPYHAFVPSFGEWGFCLAGKELPATFLPNPVPVRFFDDQTLADSFDFPKDMSRVEVGVNEIFDQQIVRYFRWDWAEI